LEFNELCLEYIRAYAAAGELPNFARILEHSGATETTSETKYEELEPWIQWVTVHTGLTFSEHGVFRLGDFVNTDFTQVWEELEKAGLRVGALSPMNAANRLKNPAFFMPDPWTNTPVSGSWLFRKLASAISQTVNDNAQSRVTARSGAILLLGLWRYAYVSRYGRYLIDAFTSRARPWRRAIVLDRLISQVFEREWRKSRPDFTSLFLNGAAFVQHHYLFSSAFYKGKRKNPEWYVSREDDPLLEIYRLYDEIVGRLTRTGDARVMLATGLHQIPFGQATYYWRLRDHARTLRSWGVPFKSVHPRMTRDFLVVCSDECEATTAASILTTAHSQDDGKPMFEVDRRGNDLFVMLTYPNNIQAGFSVMVKDQTHENFDRDVAFVAIKNGHHHGTGYFIDTGEPASKRPQSIPLASLTERVMSAFGVRNGARPQSASTRQPVELSG
jgi:hypothetical protein